MSRTTRQEKDKCLAQGYNELRVKTVEQELPDELRMTEQEWRDSWKDVPLNDPIPGKWISMKDKDKRDFLVSK